MRTFCNSGGPLAPAPFPLSSWPRLPPAPPPCAPPKPEPKPERLLELLPACEGELLLLPALLLLLLLLKDRRSAALADVPDPGATWLSGLSSRLLDDPPPNMSVRTRAICFASPYFTL